MSEEKQKVIDQLKDDPLMPLRHSAEHVLHTAMQELYPKIKRVMGPPIKDGFYFDFDLEESISPEDFEKIEAKMQEIIDAKLDIKVRKSDAEEIAEIYEDNEYKLEILDEIKDRGEEITVCEMGDKGDEHYDIDMCVGHHVKNTSDIKAFKLMSVAGAYFKGDENNKMLQRIYGVAFDSKEALDDYLAKIERAKEIDHRKLGQELDLFTFSEYVGAGLPLYTPRGTVIIKELYRAVYEMSKPYGIQEVQIPHMAKIKLYELSGHAEKFADELFHVHSHYDEFVLKPVNCPHHTQIYAARPRSYRELPIRMMESTQQHRDEKPGEIGGLTRTRSFQIDDGHTFCTIDQVKEEAMNLCKIIETFYSSLGLWGKHWVSYSVRDYDHPEKYVGSEEGWEKAEKMLAEISDELGLDAKRMEGEAAIYGPKLDFMFEDAMGNDRQLATVQIDFAMPGRFGLEYVDKDGSKKTPVMIHRAILGSYERFMAILLEHFAGALPVWLSPVQIAVIPISEKHVDYAYEIKKEAEKLNLRVEVYDKDASMGARIREAQVQKVPYMFVVGDREVDAKEVSVRLRTEEDLGAMKLNEALERVEKIYKNRSLEL